MLLKRECGNCRFMRGAYTQPPITEGGQPFEAGFCHKTVPTMSADLQSASHRPIKLIGWCGEHERLLPWWERAFYWSIGFIIGSAVLHAIGRIVLNSH